MSERSRWPDPPQSNPALAAAVVDAMHAYQELGRDIELLRDYLKVAGGAPGIDLRVAACFLSCSSLAQRLAKMQVAALRERE